MLLELKVKNFAIIENIDIQFGKGLNILSGETGAGKSVLLKSLSLLMGQKSSSESIRSGAGQASIEGSFELSKRKDLKKKLDELGIEVEDNMLVVRRVISEEKNRVYLNGTLSTLNTLRDIVAPLIEVAGHAAPLIEMTGQHENRNLLSKSYHLDLLDQYVNAWDLRSHYHEKFEKWNELKVELETLKKESQSKAQRLDFLTYQSEEIKKAGLTEEDQDFETEIKKLKNSARLGQFVDMAESALYADEDSAQSRINAVIKKSVEMESIDPAITEKTKALIQAKSLIEDYLYEIRTYVSKIDTDPAKLDRLESRLSDYRKLQKKYGFTVQEILQALEKMEAEISLLQDSDQRIAKIEKEIIRIEKELITMANDLHEKRAHSSVTLAKSVNIELNDLNMKGVTFHVMVQKLKELTSTGISDVEFMSQTSAKDPQRSLAKFASGGELSRILLSLKRVVGSSLQPRTYLFDEVDTGVSGPTAEKVGRKLKSIAKGQQVICVTHLPQVAAFGDHHFFIQKSRQKDSVAMEIAELKTKERIQEIARLISGEKISKTSLAHAESLISESQS